MKPGRYVARRPGSMSWSGQLSDGYFCRTKVEQWIERGWTLTPVEGQPKPKKK